MQNLGINHSDIIINVVVVVVVLLFINAEVWFSCLTYNLHTIK